jgi:hypothetical protein
MQYTMTWTEEREDLHMCHTTHRSGVTARPKATLVASLVQRDARGDASEEEVVEKTTWAGG